MVPTTSSWLSETSSMPSFVPSCSTRIIGGRSAASIGTAEPYAANRPVEVRARRRPADGIGSGEEDDLALGVALLQLADGVLHLVQRVGGGDREHDPAVGDPVEQLGQHGGVGDVVRADPLGAV